MSGAVDNKPLVGSPAALFRLFAGGLPRWRMYSMRLNRARRRARRREIFDSFTRTIARADHPVAALRKKAAAEAVAGSFPSFAVTKKREARRLKAIRLAGIPNSNRKPPKGPSGKHRLDIKRREAKRIAHEARAKAGVGEVAP